jgi:tryptophan 2,3-dioxygenase
MTRADLTYWDYIRVNELLALQGGRDPGAGAPGNETPGNDELHFIVVHQVFELWFTVILKELAGIRDRLGAERVSEVDVPLVVAGLKRIIEVWRSAVAHWSLVETLSPQGFLEFRDRLRPASGFQSDQLRSIEVLMGLDGDLRARVFAEFDPVARLLESARGEGESGRAVAARLGRVVEDVARKGSVRQALYAWLARTPIQGERHDAPGDRERVAGFVDGYLAAIRAQGEAAARTLEGSHREIALRGLEREVGEARRFLDAADLAAGDAAAGAERDRARRVRAGILFIETYRELPLLAWPRTVIDSIVEMEERFLMWRYGHARMVERMIGRRFGTGGSEGVGYLDKTAELRIFYDLWMVRRILVAEAFRPALHNRAFYDYAATDRLAEVMT